MEKLGYSRGQRDTRHPKQDQSSKKVSRLERELGKKNLDQSSMAKVAEEAETEPTSLTQTQTQSSSYMLLLRIMSKRRTWVCIFVLVYGVLLTSSWNFFKSMLSWYNLQAQSSSSSGWPALYVSVLLGFMFGVLSMFAALPVVVVAVLVTWITIIVLLAFFGKPKRALVVEGRKITKEIFSLVIKILLKEGNAVAALCAVLGYFALIRRNSGEGGSSLDRIG